MRNVAAEHSHVAGVGVAHFRDGVSALVEAGAEAGGARGETGGDGGGVQGERCGKCKGEGEREGEKWEEHVLLRGCDVVAI